MLANNVRIGSLFLLLFLYKWLLGHSIDTMSSQTAAMFMQVGNFGSMAAADFNGIPAVMISNRNGTVIKPKGYITIGNQCVAVIFLTDDEDMGA